MIDAMRISISQERSIHTANSARTLRIVFGAGVFLVGVFITLALTASSSELRVLFDNAHWTLACGLAAIFAWHGTQTSTGLCRQTRRYLALALTSYALGQILWVVQVFSGWNPFPGPADALYLCLGVLSGWGLLVALKQSAIPGQFRSATLDIASLGIAMLVLTLVMYLPRRGDQPLLPMSVFVAYPVTLLWAAAVCAISVLQLRLKPGPGWIAVFAGLFTNGILWLEWNARTLDNTVDEGSLFNACFSIAALVQGYGSMRWEPITSTSVRWERFCEGLLRFLPLTTVVVSAIAVAMVFAEVLDTTVAWTTLGGSGLLVLLAFMRQSLLLRERDQLLEARQSLHAQQDQYRALVEQASDGIFVADQSGRYIDVNPRGAAMLNMTREEVLQMTIEDVVVPDEIPRIAPEVDVLLKGQTASGVWKFKRADGSTFDGEVTSKMLADGRLLGMVRDISERQALEAELRQAQKLEAVGVLAAGIAHDFNNVLTAIRGYTGLAALDVGPNHPASARLEQVTKATSRAMQLVNRIVAFSRPSAPDMRTVAVPEIVDEVHRLMRSTIPAGVEFEAHCGDDLPLIYGDPAQLHQLLVNLVTNAWQSLTTSTGRIEIRVTRRDFADRDDATRPAELEPGVYACIAVSDTGCGMDEETMRHIFEPFFTTKRTGGGSGLGLSIVHRIVRHHRGAMTIDSQKDVGSTFSIYLPESREQNSVDTDASQHNIAPYPARHIVYVDDEADLVLLMTEQLRQQGHDILAFNSAQTALEYVCANCTGIDVVISDQNMPNLSGLEIAMQLRERGIQTPFILITGYYDERLRSAALDAGIHAVLQKPQDVEGLSAAIYAATRRPADTRAKIAELIDR